PDREQHAGQQEDDDEHGLDGRDPEPVVAEVGSDPGDHATPPSSSRAVVPSGPAAPTGDGGEMRTRSPGTAPSSSCTRHPRDASGSHTTWSTISVIATGTVIVPRSVDTATWSPSYTSTLAAVAADMRATGRFAVPA